MTFIERFNLYNKRFIMLKPMCSISFTQKTKLMPICFILISSILPLLYLGYMYFSKQGFISTLYKEAFLKCITKNKDLEKLKIAIYDQYKYSMSYVIKKSLENNQPWYAKEAESVCTKFNE